MTTTKLIAIVVLAVCVLGVGYAVYRVRQLNARNKRRQEARRSAFAHEANGLLESIRERKAANLPYDDLVAGFLGKTTTGPAPHSGAPSPASSPTPPPPTPPSPTPSVAASIPLAGRNDDMAAFFANTRAANPAVQPDTVTHGVAEAEIAAATAPLTTGQPIEPVAVTEGATWFDRLATQTLDGLHRAVTEVDAVASSERPDAEKAALVHQILTDALGSLPLAHLAMVRDASSGR